MHNFILLALIVFFAGISYQTSSAEEIFECSLPLDLTFSVFDEKTPGIVVDESVNVRSVDHDSDAKQLKQSITLPDGIKISYEASGCTHYFRAMRFDNIPNLPQGDLSSETLDYVIKLVQFVPLLSDDRLYYEATLNDMKELMKDDEAVLSKTDTSVAVVNREGETLSLSIESNSSFLIETDFPL